MVKPAMICALAGAWLCASLSVSWAAADTIHVPGDFPTIQEAVDAAIDGDTVLVAPGVYHENVLIEFKAITLASSGGPTHTTVVAADGRDPVLTLFVTDVGGLTSVDGFTLTGGTGGIDIAFAEVALANCIINENPNAPGIDMFWTEATISNCTISSNGGSNVAGGGLHAFLSTMTIGDSAFAENRGLTGGAVYMSETIASFQICEFMANEGEQGGGLFFGYATVSLVGCTFTKNLALDNGGAVLAADFTFGTTLLVDGCSFSSNSAAAGGGILIEQDPLVIVEIGDTAFCANEVDHVTGDWTDRGGNSFEDACRFADINGDGVVDVTDLMILLAAWGECPEAGDCPADLNVDGVVDVSDLLILIANWT